jgi:hypothetical protein
MKVVDKRVNVSDKGKSVSILVTVDWNGSLYGASYPCRYEDRLKALSSPAVEKECMEAIRCQFSV